MAMGGREKASEAVEAAARILAGRRRLTILTGAGVSVESGIPDFRSATGLWTRYNPMEYASAWGFASHPRRCWALFTELGALLGDAEPNAAHRAIAALEDFFERVLVVTQNIDGLHQAAGSREVLEFHGSGTRLSCPSCQHIRDALAYKGVDVPTCECGAVLKPDIVLFGDPIPAGVWEESAKGVMASDAVLVVGTSATVAPFSELPYMAARGGIPVLEVNLEPTGLSALSTSLLRGEAGSLLPALVDALGAAGSGRHPGIAPG